MIHLVVSFKGHRTRYFPVPPDQGWKVDADSRQIIVGTGVPRTHIPLDNVLYYSIEECEGNH